MPRTTRRLTLLSLIAAVAVSLAASAPAQAKTKWLCLPGQSSNACAKGLGTTSYTPDGKRIATSTPKTDRRRKIDCFYVYPTVSDQPGVNATLRADLEQREIARFQAARYSQHCRVFAPLYRQLTLKAIMGDQAAQAKGARIAYADVLAAWKDYLRKYNKGRGVVLIGHSQGSGMLSQLIRTQIDPSAKARKKLVSAFILGGQVTVKKGSDRGGSFKHIPACRSTTQLGCVVAFSTYNQTPPANSLFGRVGGRYSNVFKTPTGKGFEILCTNPAALAGGAKLLDTIVPTRPFSLKTTIGLGNIAVGFPVPKAATTYVESRTFEGHCSSAGGARTLQALSLPGAPVPKPVPDATWGLHLLDGNVALGNLVDLVGSQAKAFAKRAAKH